MTIQFLVRTAKNARQRELYMKQFWNSFDRACLELNHFKVLVCSWLGLVWDLPLPSFPLPLLKEE